MRPRFETRLAVYGLSLLVPYSELRGFSPGTPVFPSPQKAPFDFNLFALTISFI